MSRTPHPNAGSAAEYVRFCGVRAAPPAQARLRIVRAISDTGSITGAAESLGYSQPAISQNLRRLEARVGRALVERVGRDVRLTDAGHVLARHAPAVSLAVDAPPKSWRSRADCAPDSCGSSRSRPRRPCWCRG